MTQPKLSPEAARRLSGAKVLITGGTGNVGSELLRQLLPLGPAVVRIFSRDEAKQHDMQEALGDPSDVRFLLGDVRDLERLRMAMEDIDVVFHAAGLKHVKACEYNPFEAVKTNVMGTDNVIEAARLEEVERVIFCSTDKAVNPSNAMGATKLMAERLMTAANNTKGGRRTVFATTRFGNVVGTRGSAMPVFRRQIEGGGPVTLTSPRMTRFVMTLQAAARLVLEAACLAKGGEVFVPKMPAVRIADLARVMIDELRPGSDVGMVEVGVGPGEKYFEELMTAEELSRSLELEDFFIVLPAMPPLSGAESFDYPGARPAGQWAFNSEHAALLPPEGLRRFLRDNELL